MFGLGFRVEGVGSRILGFNGNPNTGESREYNRNK